MSSATESAVQTRSRRRQARRSSCSARVIVGADEDVLQYLQSDDDSFFGAPEISTDSSSSEDESFLQPAAKVPRVADSWSDSSSSSSETGSEASEENFVSDDSDESDDEPANEKTMVDMEEDLSAGCGCKEHNHFTALPTQTLVTTERQMREVQGRDKDTLLLGILTASQNEDAVKHHGRAATASAARTRTTFDYTIKGQSVCKKVFCRVYRVGATRLRRIQKLVRSGVCVPAPHGNVGHTPWNVYTEETRQRAVEFLKNFASINGLPMPAAPRGRAQTAPTYLPSSCTKHGIWTEYSNAAEAGVEAVGHKTFMRLWKKHLPNIQIMNPRFDVCAKCEDLRDKMKHASSEFLKLKISSDLRSHVELAQQERGFYTTCIDTAKNDPASFTHLTFDFAENFAIPHHARQPGPVYFKVLFRVNNFGIVDEAGEGQVHHLYHEGQTIAADNGKSHGPNCVVSMLHRYLEKTPHAKVLHAHCDNCTGQNKNKTVLAYLCWRILVGLEDDIKLSFMIVGHTRCTVDGGFGVVKKKFRSSDTDTAAQLTQMINASGHRNKAVLFDWEWLQWDEFLQTFFKKVQGITSYQHFHLSKAFPGQVKMKKAFNSEEVVTLQLVKDPQKEFDHSILPAVLPAAGLTEARRKYLRDSVRPFCRLENRDSFDAMLE